MMTALAECAGMRTHGLTPRLHPILLNLNLLWCSRKHGKKLGLFSCHVRKTRPINFCCQARKTNLLFFLPCEEDKYIIFLATWGRLDLFFLPCEEDFFSLLAMWMKICKFISTMMQLYQNSKSLTTDRNTAGMRTLGASPSISFWEHIWWKLNFCENSCKSR